MILDVRGEICPYPMLKTVEALKRLPQGEILEVYTDHPPALETIPTQAARLGYSWRIEALGPGEWRIVIYRESKAAWSRAEVRQGRPGPGLVMTAEELARCLGDPALRVLDVRPVIPALQSGYPYGHVPGALHLDLEAVLAPQEPEQEALPSISVLEERLGALGLRLEDPVVIVDGSFGPAAGLAAWLLDYLGQASIAVLEGGWEAWLQGGYPVETQPQRRAPTLYQARPNPDRLATAEWIRSQRGRADLMLLDVRTAAEYAQGHLPGALHLPWDALLVHQPYPRLADPELLRERLAGMGLDPAKEIVVYCESGARSAHTYWMLRTLGYPRVRNYKGSWADWRRRGWPFEEG